MDNGIIHIDCTLRDGGYYTNWDFSKELIDNYLKSLSFTSINYIEIGFRSNINKGFKGVLAFANDGFINSLSIPENKDICVMINAAEFKEKDSFDESLEALFPKNAEFSPVKLVRIASHFDEIDIALACSDWLFNKNYKVGINLMQISERNTSEIVEVAKKIDKYPISVFYFADSLGSIDPEFVKESIRTIKENTVKPIGIHAHDNLGLALSNTLAAIESGAKWVDSTITGMGRGPGNCKTEELLIEFDNLIENKNNISPIFSLINKYFTKMREEYKWGTNPYYYLSGKYRIHPSYIQNLLTDPIYSDDDRLMIINKLKEKKAIKFSPDFLTRDIIKFNDQLTIGSWNPEEKLKDREVLILATGPSTRKYKLALEKFIFKYDPIVIALNTPTPINQELINYRAACHPLRILTDVDAYKKMNKPLICPFLSLEKSFASKIDLKNVLDFGIRTEINKFEFNSTYCVLPNPLVLFYSIALSISGKAKSIYLSGVDGYESGDPRNEQLENLFEKLLNNKPEFINIKSITPSCYRAIEKESIFSYL